MIPCWKTTRLHKRYASGQMLLGRNGKEISCQGKLRNSVTWDSVLALVFFSYLDMLMIGY